MPDPRYPAAIWNPGTNAGYRAGRTSMRSVVCHETIGRNSTGVGKQGIFQFLVSRDGTVQQFAEADAVNWHAGQPWNSRGPGVEVEYHPSYDTTVFTDEARAATRALCEWLRDEWSVPFTYYDGDRVTEHDGFISHRSLIQTGDWHHDWWPAEDAAVIFAKPPIPTPQGSSDMWALYCLHSDNTSTLLYGVANTIILDLHGTQGYLGLPTGAMDYVGLNLSGVTTKTTSLKVLEDLRRTFTKVG